MSSPITIDLDNLHKMNPEVVSFLCSQLLVQQAKNEKQKKAEAQNGLYLKIHG